MACMMEIKSTIRSVDQRHRPNTTNVNETAAPVAVQGAAALPPLSSSSSKWRVPDSN